jgi:WD40 repeat protein
MEGTGLYSSASRRKVDWIVVKAICDWADENKQHEKTSRQKLASENAILFTLHVLRQGGFVESAGSAPQFSAAPRHHAGARGTLLRTYDVHASWVVGVAWEPEGTRIASAAGDGTVRIWDADTGHSLLTYRGHTRLLSKINIHPTIYSIAWAPEGLRLVSSGDGANIYVWNGATGQTLTVYQDHSGLLPNVYAAVWSLDGKYIASACSSAGTDKTIHIWDASTGRTIHRYQARYGILPNFSVLSVAWSPDGILLAAACGDKTIRIWNTQTHQLIATYNVRTEWTSHIAWSPNSQYIATAHSDRTAQIWNIHTGACTLVYRGHSDSVRYIAWSPDGTCIASASNDRTVQLWNSINGSHIYTYRGHSEWVTSLTWSPDGTCIASASNDKTVQIWQAQA